MIGQGLSVGLIGHGLSVGLIGQGLHVAQAVSGKTRRGVAVGAQDLDVGIATKTHVYRYACEST